MKMMRRYRRWRDKCATGWKRNKEDKRDFIAGNPHFDISKKTDLSDLLPSKNNWLYQGNLGSCVAQAVANQMHAEIKKTNQSYDPFISRLYLYYYARYLENNKPPKSQGAYPRLAYHAIKKIGRTPESAWPYSSRKKIANRKPNNKARRYAMKHSITYHWIKGVNISDKIRGALTKGHVVTIGTQVTQEMIDYVSGSGTILKQPNFIEKRLGGHYMTIYGHEKNHFMVANSWHGREHILLDESYIEWMRSGDFCMVTL